MREPSIHRYDAMVAVRHQPLLPTAGHAARPYEAVSIARHPTVRTIAAAPYARPLPSTTQHLRWRAAVAQHWVQAHLILTLLLAVTAITLVLRPSSYPLGMWLLGFAVIGIALGTCALGELRGQRIAPATALMLTFDLLLVGLGLALIGPRMEVCALLPGMLLVSSLLMDYRVVIGGGVLMICGFALAVALQQFDALHPVLALDAGAVVWLDLLLVLLGGGLFLLALLLGMRQLRAALAGEAAATHTVTMQDRRAQTRRVAIDADAIALQTQLARSLRGNPAQPVTTCEDLAPLAQMINATTQRIPGLLRDREERIKLERAIRELTTALETAWAGFTWHWPTPTGTAVDRLVTILRPSPAPTEVTGQHRS